MSPDGARKIVVAMALVGIVVIGYNAQKAGTPTKTTYKKLWGWSLLTAGGSVLSDLAPAVVGPYMFLVLLGFLFSNQSGISSLLGEAKTNVQGGATG